MMLSGYMFTTITKYFQVNLYTHMYIRTHLLDVYYYNVEVHLNNIITTNNVCKVGSINK